MQWTEEQLPAIHSFAKKLLVQAFAGTGKTTTLVGYATHNSSVKMLYLCYNKAVEIAAKNRFPRNVTCKTAHGLAYAVLWQPVQTQAGWQSAFDRHREDDQYAGLGAGQRYRFYPQCLHGQQ
ncbi:hypothetical protein PSYPI_27479, partial [Pseudomonas syringae pv. pisi str. 1704B]